MISVNLLPGGKKRSGRGGRSGFSMPSFGSLPLDAWSVVGAVIVIGSLLFVGTRFQGLRGERASVEEQIAVAVEDSARYADVIRTAETLVQRRDTVSRRVAIIQDIDQARYTWAHVLDEVARSLPEFTWLTSVAQSDQTGATLFGINGIAATPRAITTFMENLEASPFLNGIRLGESELVSGGEVGGGARNVYRFTLRVLYEQPPIELLETAPLLGAGFGLAAVSDEAREDSTNGIGG